MENLIEIQDVVKRFGEQTVLDHVSLSVTPGKIYGIIGRNGSGKTVLFKSICGFVLPDAGKILVRGKQVGKDVDIPQGIGIIIEHPGFLRDYSGFQNLKLLARLQKKITDEKIKESIRLVGLDPEDKKKVGKFSLGMRQRLGIAQAIMESPDILILDEPMNGLDDTGDAALKTGDIIKANLLSDTITKGIQQLGSVLKDTASNALNTAMSNETAFAKASTLLKSDDFTTYYQGLIDISNRTGVAFGDLAESMYSALSAGVDQEKSLISLKAR